jgi:hypothetical protein
MGIDYDNVVRFIFAGGGLSAIGPGWVKGIEYVAVDCKRVWDIVHNLDKARLLPAGVYLRPIERKWFIFYQRDD